VLLACSYFFTSGTDKLVRRFTSYDDEQPLEAEEHQEAITAMAVKVPPNLLPRSPSLHLLPSYFLRFDAPPCHSKSRPPSY